MSSVPSDLSALTPAQRAVIERRVIERRAARARADRIASRSPGARIPLSYAQQRLWFLHQLHSESRAYRVPLALRLVGELRAGALERALNALVERHESLRTVFVDGETEPEQRILPPAPVAIERVEVDVVDAENRERQIVALASAFVARPFDLTQGPLFRVQLLRVGPHEHVLVFVLHHIIADVWSLAVLAREFGVFYRAAIDGAAEPPALTLQYGDYATWQRNRLTGDVLARELEYWRAQLAGAVPHLDLPTDRPRPPVQSLRGARIPIHFPPALMREVKALARRSEATLFNTLSAAMAVLLSRYTGQDDLLLGYGNAGRNRAELEPLVGLFVNTLVLRSSVADDPTFATLLTRLRNAALDAAAHHDMPFEMLAREFDPDRDLSRNPLVQVLISVQNMPMEELRLPGLEVSLLEVERNDAHADLALFVAEVGDSAEGVLEYDADLFEPATIERMATHLLTLLAAAAADPLQRVSALPLMPPAEQRALRSSDGVSIGLAPAEFVDAQVAAHAALTPAATAVADERVTYDYRELDARAGHLARRLQALGVTAEVRVPVLMHRCADGVVALLAVLKAGGAYVPLDPSIPDARIAFAIDDTRPPVILTHSAYRSRLDRIRQTELICVDELMEAVDLSITVDPPRRTAAAESLAYVIYTSGSTGQPKGVEVTHAGLANLIGWHRRAYDIGPRDRGTHLAGVGFDASVWEIWPYLSAGASVHIPPADALLDPEALWQYLEHQRITVSFMPTPLAEATLRHPPPRGLALKALLTGGDRLTCGADRAWPFLFVNHYGPTENSVVATAYTLQPGDTRTPPIGRGIDNVSLHVLDRRQQPVPCGVHGELFIAGPSLARGYQGRPDLTAERFVPNPFSAVPGARMYRTGDIVRRLPAGELEFVGRNDQQIKVRGFRIEIGEIENAIRAHATVADAVVLLRSDAGEPRLVAYLVPSAEAASSNVEDLNALLRASLKDRLPEYMVPAAFVVMPSFPLTPNGKIDRRALPPPSSERADDVAGTPPRGAVESVIADVWRELLGCDRVSVHDNFFDLGGHSLLLVRVHAELRKRLQRKIAIVDLFRYPTIEALARHLAPEGAAVAPAADNASPRPDGPARWAEPVAIIGMAGRFPGARDIEAFWDNLRRGVESITFFDEEELAAAGIPAQWLADARYVRARGIVDDADKFDAGLFGYTPREAEIMDPQQRMFLECAWEALEHAGYDPEQFAGPIGVFAGAGFNSYLRLIGSDPALADYNPVQLGIASDKDFLATRVAYKLNLRGPSMAVQTACSTSLVAVHMACRSLQSGDCAIALAGGVRLTVPQESGYHYQDGSILSPDGRCRVFDAGAKGTVSGNGSAVVVLKRLADAVADGDTVHAVIIGSAVNNDGSQKVGFTAPGVEGQAAVIRAAHRAAGVDPRTIAYVEAHGTGTTLGDPVEVAALTAAFGTDGQHCALGSVKSNIGHLDAAAGAAGLIKAALSVARAELVPTLHYTTPNPVIDFAHGPFTVNTAARPWPPNDGPRRAGVSSFGLGGTNAHVVIEQAPPVAPAPTRRGAHLIVQSARTPEALDILGGRLLEALETNRDLDLGDVAHTLQVGRRALAHRRALVCQSREDAIAVLRQRDALPGHDAAAGGPPSVVFMFSGQGAQRVGMMRELYDSEPVFRAEVDRCAELLLPITGGDLRDALYLADGAAADADSRLQQTAVAQPALFVTEYALARLWLSWGVRPDAMIGHSIGEYVAACLAGVMSLESALGVVAMRGRLMQEMPAGAMIAVPLDEDGAASLVGDGVSIAAVNAPGQVVLSGSLPAIAAVEARLRDRGVTPQRLQTSHAFHSAMMEPILARFREHVAGMTLARPAIPFVSNVTGQWIGDRATSPDYWVEHLRSTVRFADGIRTLAATPGRVFLEVGPGQALATLAKHGASGASTIASLPRGLQSDTVSMMTALGRLWTMGAAVNWAGVYAGEQRRRIVLPTYPFERSRYWRDGSRIPNAASPRAASAETRLPIDDWQHVVSWTSTPPVGARARIAGTCLVFADDELGELLAEEAGERGADVIVVNAGKRFDGLTTRCTIDPGDAEDYRALWSALVDDDRVPSQVIHAFGAVVPPSASASERLRLTFSSALHLVQAAVACGITETFGLTLVTNGVHDIIGDEPLDEAAAMLLALARVAGHECPNIGCRAIDLHRVAPRLAAAVVVDELASGSADTTVAYRHARRWIPSFARLAAGSQREPRLRHGGVYLITGGTGGIGLEIAGRLADEYEANVVLVSRRMPAPGSGVARQVEELTLRGRRVQVVAADAADAVALRRIVDGVVAQFGALHGVIHAAGADKSPVPLPQLRETELRTQLAPRLDAVAALDVALGDRAIDFCVVSSSIGAVLGVIGHCAYTAAHLAMDTFVARRNRTAPVRWTTINWDNWVTWKSSPDRAPAEALSAAEGWTVLRNVLANAAGVDQVLVSTVDLAARSRQWATRGLGASARSAVSPSHARPALAATFAAPQSDVERTLCGIWEQLLGISPIGIHDNFFELGGDSVIGIQVVSKAASHGLRLSASHVFQHQTVAELAGALNAPVAVVADTRGPAPLTPIQQWFFEQQFANPQHFNQARLVTLRRPIDESVMHTALTALVEHHDALRLRFWKQDAAWRQESGPATGLQFEVVACGDLSADARAALVEHHANALHARFDYAAGRVFGAVYFTGPEPSDSRLLLAAHHLVVDAVSWRTILDDLEMACAQLLAHQPVRLPPPSASYTTWAHALTAAVPTLASESGFWLAQAGQRSVALPRDFVDGANVERSASTIEVTLNAADTELLMRRAADTAAAIDLIVTALATTLLDWAGGDALRFDFEGHGRESMTDGVDVARTVGWFTALHPVTIQLNRRAAPADRLASVQQQLRSVPKGGLGYGVLRHLGADDVADVLARASAAEVLLLYLGRVDAAGDPDALFAPAAEPTGRWRDAAHRRSHVLECTAYVSDGLLRVRWSYSESLHRAETIGRLAERFLVEIRTLLQRGATAPGNRPPNKPAAGARPGSPRREQVLTALQRSGRK